VKIKNEKELKKNKVIKKICCVNPYSMYKLENKLFSPHATWEMIRSIIPSGYVRKGTLQVFHKIRRSYPNDHILCVGYRRGDTQFGITETFKTYETDVQEVVDRCLEEECSMERTPNAHMDLLSFVYHEKFATIYCVPMRVTHENLRYKAPMYHRHPVDIDADDDKRRKLVLLLHGPPDVIRDTFQHFQSVEMEISHLASIPVSGVQYAFPKLFPSLLYPSIYKNSFISPSNNRYPFSSVLKG